MAPGQNQKPRSEPDPNRITTRPKNAVTHPGHIVYSQTSTRRPESIIQAEKAEKAAKRAKKEQKIIKQREAAEAIAEYEQTMALNDAIDDTQFPRHRDKADRGKPPNAKQRSTSGTKRKIEDSNQPLEKVDNGPEVDSGVEEQPKLKRTRLDVVPADHSGVVDVDSVMSELTETEAFETPKPKRVNNNTLRRTETYIDENLEEEMTLEPEGAQELEYCTPKPNEEETGSKYHTDLEEDEDESVFVSPLKTRKKPAPVADSDSGLTGTDDGGFEAKRKGKGKTASDKRAFKFREMVQEKRTAMTTPAKPKQRILIKPAGNSKAASLSLSQGENGFDGTNTNDDDNKTPFVTFERVPSKKKTQQVNNATLRGPGISSQGEDDSLQSMSQQAEDAYHDSIDRSLQKRSRKNQAVTKTSHGGNREDLREDSDKTQLVKRVSKASKSDDASAKPQQVKKASKTQGHNIPPAVEEAQTPGRSAPNVRTTTTARAVANKSETSRTTAINRVSITKASNPPVPKKKSHPKLKPDSISIKTANGGLSGDEDQREREEMLASPVKGLVAQTASKALIKLEKTNEKPKSRSKAELLQLEKEDVITWNNTLEPSYVRYFLSTESLWSADTKLLEVAQHLYDETLGLKKPLILTPSSGPIKLLNQKLNDVRNQTGKTAITNLEASFIETVGSESLEEYTPKAVASMRIKFAQNLLEDYRFLFGPDIESEDGSITRGKRFFNPLILQTFSSVFKHTVGRIPPSFPQIGHPIVALALACVSVERAVRIWADGIYDAHTGKIIAKINPVSNKPSKETAFSSTIWADATNKYVKKITTLKDDVWRELMDEASSYAAFTWEDFTATSATLDPHATDRDRALFSDED